MGLTFFLDQDWDVTVDSMGRLKMSDRAYSIAQHVANSVRLFTEDAFFAQDSGIPHFDIDLGRKPLYSVLRSRIRAAALAVDGVLDAAISFDSPVEGRKLTGEILLTIADGEKSTKMTVTF